MRHFTMSLAIAMFLFTSPAQAEESFHHATAKLFIHAGLNLPEDRELRVHFVTADNLNNSRAYLGIELKPTKWLHIEPTVGWLFGSNEALFSLHLVPTFGKFHGLIEAELQMFSKNVYFFTQLDYQLVKFLYIGAEIDYAGKDSEMPTKYGYSGGPNLLLRLGKFGFDLTVHARNTGHSIEPQFMMRAHLFL